MPGRASLSDPPPRGAWPSSEAGKVVLAGKTRQEFRPGDFQVISVSIPCEHHGMAHTRSFWDIAYANRLAKKTLRSFLFFKSTNRSIANLRFGYIGILAGSVRDFRDI